MPLPQSGPLSLFGYSRPGETAQSKPKQAIIVRMSAETLDALDSFPNQPQMDFMLGDQGGIHIGDAFFPMLPVKEDMPHEIYLRASSAGKKNAPLKLYANVIGKFTVVPQLGERLTDKIRETTLDAVNQRNGRATIMLDAPPISAPNPRKRKDPPLPSNMFRNTKAPRPSDQPKPNASASASTAPARVASPAPRPSTSKEALAPLRRRMLQCLAVNERSLEDLVRTVGGANCSPAVQRDIRELVGEIAEVASTAKSSSDKAPKLYRLKPESWKEVRPHEWPRLTEPERTNMARQARYAFKALGIPESDPVWDHVRYRNPGPAIPNSIPTNSSAAGPSRPSTGIAAGRMEAAKAEPPKRGVSSKEAKERKAKPKADPKAEVMMKNESIRAAPRASQALGKVKEPGEVSSGRSTPTTAASALRKPSSGSKVTKNPAQQDPGVHHDTRKSIANGKSAEGRSKDAEPSSAPLARPPPPSPNRERKAVTAVPTQRVKKLRDEDHGGASDTERDRRRDRGRDRDRVREKARPVEREEGEHSDTSVALLKRKKPARDVDDRDGLSRGTVQKRRKTEGNMIATPPSMSKNPKNSVPTKSDLLPPKSRPMKKEPSPLPPSLPKMKKEPSPLPPPLPRIRKDPLPSSRPSLPSTGKVSPATASTSSTASNDMNGSNSRNAKVNGASKPRRRSPKYTSSEDEAPPSSAPPRREAPSTALPTPHTTKTYSNSQAHSGISATINTASRASRPLPSDHRALRARYRASYSAYLKTFHKLYDQKNKLDTLLHDSELGSAGSVTDSDGDVELLDADELERLTLEHEKLKAELETIQQIFARSGKSGSSSD